MNTLKFRVNERNNILPKPFTIHISADANILNVALDGSIQILNL